jgi:hypothetical protein
MVDLLDSLIITHFSLDYESLGHFQGLHMGQK